MSTERFPGLRRVLRLGAPRRELDDELAFHFERTVEELMERGRTRREAEEEARRRFGDERRWRREMERLDRGAEARRRWGERAEVGWESVRLGLRRLRRSPGFAAAVVLTFGLGIGANATMFGILDRLLLSPPAHVEDADALRRVVVNQYVSFAGKRSNQLAMSYPDYVDLARAKSFSGAAAISGGPSTLGQGAEAQEVESRLVTGSFFSLLGARPAIGRFFGPEEDREGVPGVAVIGHSLWQRRFGGDREILGRVLDLGIGRYTVVGVAPPGFTGVDLERVDVWLPLHVANAQRWTTPWRESRSIYWLRVVARLAPGASPGAAEAEATALLRQGRAEQIRAGDYDPTAKVLATPLLAARGPDAPPESVVARWLAGISLGVLLIACANVANLLLARSVRQRREVGIRLALGSSRARVLGQVLVESLMLALLGGVAALLLARFGGGLLRGALLPNVAWEDTGLELNLTLVVVALALLAGVAAGAIPAVQGSRPDVTETLKSGARGSTGHGSRTRDALTVVQAALSVVLLVGAGLFVRSLHQVRALDMGFDPDRVLFFSPVFDPGVSDARKKEYVERARERLRAMPGVENFSAEVSVPFYSSWAVGLRAPGLDSIPRLSTGSPILHVVDPGYFAALDLRIRRGRGILETDTRAAPRVVVVNATMARTLWPREEAIGKCLIVNDDEEVPGEPPCSTVVGVVEDARTFKLAEGASMQYYIPWTQEVIDAVPSGILLRVRGEERAQAAAVRREMQRLDPTLRYAEVRPLRELIDPEARSWRLGATMFSVFGALALLVAGIGLYSVLAFGVAQRTQELGIRAALGATRERLMRMVVGRGLRLVGLGVALGLATAALAATRVEPLLFQVRGRDPLTLAAAAATLLLVGVLASWLPARRATRVDPSAALRAE